MALLNQGFIRSLNLDDIEDAILSVNNLAGGTITEDLVVFANNDKNTTRLLFKRPSLDSNNSVVTDGDGSVFTQADKIGTFGNGDRVYVRSLINITNMERDGQPWASNDQIRVTLEKPLPVNFFDPANGQVKVTLQETRFELITDLLNNKEYVATGVFDGVNAPIQFFLNEVGYPEDLDSEGVDQNAIGNFDPDGPNDNLDNYPYITSPQLPGPNVVSGEQISYNQLYFIANSNAINEFRIGRNFSRRELIDQIDFGSAFSGDVGGSGYTGTQGCSVVFERVNTCVKENLLNLSLPVFEDTNDFTYTSGALLTSINGNFSSIENSLDSATFYTLKKYLSREYNYFDENELEFAGNLFTSDPDAFNQTTTDLTTTDKSPGVYIINKDASPSFDNLVLTRAYSDNTQPWELSGTTLEYQVLRDFDGNRPAFNVSNQEMSIGNMILQDKSVANGGTDAVEIGSATELLQNVDVLTAAEATAIGPILAQDAAFARFTHKMNVLIDTTGLGPEFYSICLSTVADAGTAPGSS